MTSLHFLVVDCVFNELVAISWDGVALRVVRIDRSIRGLSGLFT
ncbi:hypothetical protein QWZ16_19815 [Vibrio ostreicida]|uniref:Uncharacterized protein n=1 Tax=Vibrio ostreicida TaxID=526588 RepID=A0ABT8C0G2_9VIBR|nr:hypothetical protein [Vibrio ostreicida]MDN3611845.1 hypothetical protein [Vibrio ostreicida]